MKLVLMEVVWGTMDRAERERRFARTWMTRAEDQLRRAAQVKRKKAAKAQESLAERRLQALKPGTTEQAQVWMQSSKRRPELTEPLNLK